MKLKKQMTQVFLLTAGVLAAVFGLEAQTCTSSGNQIACENALQGTSGWETNEPDPTIQGFATEISLNAGEAASFMINTDASAYRIDIYRLGYYGGLGARKVATVRPSAALAQIQPACHSESGLLDCANWSPSASWTVPADAVSGVYAANLVREDTGGRSQVLFIVRNDGSKSDLVFQTADLTWQANNSFGLSDPPQFRSPRNGKAISYNRPMQTRPSFFDSEYPMLRWLEANGYDVSYLSGVDVARSSTALQNHRVYLSVGQDAYWSAEQRKTVESARDAGVNLAFLSGASLSREVRWIKSARGVSYRAFTILSPGGIPQNALTGTLFAVDAEGQGMAIRVPAADGKLRFWRNTDVGDVARGGFTSLPAGTLGGQWDSSPDNGFRPAGEFALSAATFSLSDGVLLDGDSYGAGTATHRLSLYRAPSGALVFGAGTARWSWGLDATHDGPATPVDWRMQQATVNLFADMGIQPSRLQAGLMPATRSLDTTAPVSTIVSPASGSSFPAGRPVTIRGTASDFGSGVVAGVEVSVDGGLTWHPASGRETWTFTWTPQSASTASIQTRAVDDSGNLEAPSAPIALTASPAMASVDNTVSTDGANPASSIASPAFSTTAANELLLAFISTDYTSGANTTVTGVTGAGLTWTLVQRTNVQQGTAEIWRAFATAPLTNVTVTANLSLSVVSSITVMSFQGVDTTGTNGSGAIGATASGNGASGGPTASLTTTRANSIVVGVGTDWDNAISRTLGPGQTLVHQYLAPINDTYWVQMTSAPVPVAGTVVTINDTAPTSDRYNLSIVEVLNPGTTLPTYTLSGSVTPVPGGAGVTLALSGAGTGTVTSDTSGNFSFASLANGTYTVTPSKAGYAFSPMSQTVTINSANVSGVAFTASAVATYSVSGSITPLPGGAAVTLALTGAATGSATSDTSGNFSFASLANGTYTITPSKSGYTFTPASQTVTVSNANITGVAFTASASAAIQFVQAATNGSESSGTTMSVAFPSANTAGNFLIITATAARPAGTLTISDTLGNTFVPAMGPVNDPAQDVNVYIWYVPNCKGGANTVKTVPSASAALEIHVAEFSGIDPANPLDQTSSATGNGTSDSSGAKTTTSNGELIYGYGFVGPTSSSVGAGFTGLAYINGDWSEYQIQPVAGSVAATFTQPTGVWLALMATFRPVGSFRAAISGTVSPAATAAGTTLTLSGTATGTATVDGSGNYSFGGLANGSYTVTPSKSGYAFAPASQTVTVNGANISGVNFVVGAIGSGTLSLSQSYLLFSATPGTSPASANITVNNTGSGSLNFSAASDATWLSVTPATGTAPQPLQLSAASSTLNPGTYIGHVNVTAPGASGSPGIITVVLNVGVAGDWITADHDPARLGNAIDESILSPSNVAGLQLSWTAIVDAAVTAQPLYVRSVTIGTQTRDLVIVGTGNNTIYALDGNTGATVWSRNLGATDLTTYGLPDGFGIEGSPVIDRATNRIYTVATNGSFRTLSLLDGSDVFAALPVVVNPATNKVWGGLNKVGNSVYFPVGSNGGDVAPWRGQVYQIDVSSTPALVGNFVVVPSIPAPNGGGGIWGNGGVSADLITGNIYAATSFDSVVGANGNEGYAPYADSVVALNSKLNLLGYYQPSQPSTFPCGGAPCDLDFAGTPVIFQPAGCPVLTAVGNKNGNLYLFRTADLAASGQPLQILTLNVPYDSIGLGGVPNVQAYSPANNMLYVADAGPGVTGVSGGLIGLNVTSNCTLQVAWSNQLQYANDVPNSTPTVANGIVFVGEGKTGIIHAYNAQTGVQLWQSGTNYKAAATFAAPIVAAGKVIAGSWTAFSGGGIVGAFTLPASNPILSLAPSLFNFTATAGGSNPPSSTLNVTNTGAGTLSFSAASDSAWLTVSPASGTAPAALQVSASITGLAAGTYTGHITVTASGAQGSPATILVTLTVSPGGSTGTVSVDVSVSKDNASPSTSIVTSAFSTVQANELLLAMIASDASSNNVSVSSVTGGGLTWTLAARANKQPGTAEVWRAFAPTALSNVTVTATLSQSVTSSLAVMSFSGVDTTGTGGSGAIGATAVPGATSGAPTASLVTTRNNSLVVGVGVDYDNAISRTLGPNQTLIHQYLSPSNDTYWMQRQSAATPAAGTTVTINDTAPTGDRYNLAIVEVLPSQGPSYSISGSVTPAASGTGTVVTLSGAGTGTATADASGNFTFTGLANGTYTLTPAKAGFTFSPASQTVTVSGVNITGVAFTISPIPTYTISGSISPAASGSGTVVTLSGAGTGTSTADVNGNFSFANLANGTYTLTPAKTGFTFSPASQTVTVSSVNITGVAFTISPIPTYTISGSISPAASGSGTVVTLSGAGTGTSTADVNGNFSFANLANGTYTLTPAKTGFTFSPASQTVTVSNASISGVAFTITAISSYTISGSISPAASGSGTVVTLSGAGTGTSTADVNGNFSFANLANGTYTLTPAKTGFTFSPASQTVTVSNASITGAAFTITAISSYTISGSISPAASGSGTVVTLSGAGTGTSTADAKGIFSFANLASGTYTLTPAKTGFTFSPATQTVTVSNANITGVAFTITPIPTYSISGTISPAAVGSGAVVTLSGAGTGSATADANGNFTFSGLANGAYTLTPTKSGYSFSPASQAVTVSNANVTGVAFTVITSTGILNDVTVSQDNGTPSTTLVSPAFSTTAANELLLAIVSTDLASGNNTTVTGVTGGSLTWALVVRSNTQSGTSEIWRAFAPSTLTNATVTATLSQSVSASLVVMSFSGVDTTGTNGSGAIGATNATNANPGAPTASLVTTRNGSWVVGVGNDYDNALSRTVGAGQTLVHQFLSPVNDTYWVQMQTSPTPLTGTIVTINDTAPVRDRYNLAICEILPHP